MIKKVSREDHGDDQLDRLSSFLYLQGKLASVAIRPIKPRVYLLQISHNKGVILKRHGNKRNVEQQWHFFSRIRSPAIVPFIRFPNGEKMLEGIGSYWTIAPFIHGEKLDYGNAADRAIAVDTLKKFHRKARTIRISNPIKKDPFYIRWFHRLAAFEKTDFIFAEIGLKHLFLDIVRTTRVQLKLLPDLPWNELEQDAQRRWTWIHGDVASHNFIKNKNVYMIDFDMLEQSMQVYDFIQLGQRFLPHVNGDVEKLLSTLQMKGLEQRLMLYSVMIPSDILREWLALIHCRSGKNAYQFLTKLESDWIKRKSFLTNAKIMLKSL